MEFKELKIKTSFREELIDITDIIKNEIKACNMVSGIIHIWIPHTTAAVTINENADPDVPKDIVFALNKVVPNYIEFKHSEGNSDAHLKSSLMGCEQDVLVKSGQLWLGTWQGIFFCEFDGPRNRKINLMIDKK
jgi:secondary thiamine-phosphate synthase enzyme